MLRLTTPAPAVVGIAFATMLSLSARPIEAQAPATTRPLPSILTYQTTKIAEGIYAFITPEERSGFQAGNSIAIIGDDGVLIIDSGNLPSATRRQIAELRTLTSQPVRYVVNTHWHPDHNLGNATWRAAFPHLSIVGTSATRAGIVERVPGYIADMKGFATTDSLMKVRLRTGLTRDGKPLDADTRLFFTTVTQDYDTFLPEVLSATPEPPDVVFDDSLTIHLGRRVVKVLSDGRGNTAGDAYVWVPDARVLITGDLVTFPCPFPSTSYVSDWIRALDALKSYQAVAIVPGHGAVQHDAAYIDLVRELLVYTRTQTRDAVRQGLSLDSTEKVVDFKDFVTRFTGGDPLRLAAFNNFWVYPGIERAYEEAKFASESPNPKR
jgi:cyclase